MAKEYEIRTTAEFWTDYEKLSKSEQERIDKVKEQLKTNPYVGKPLGYKFFSASAARTLCALAHR